MPEAHKKVQFVFAGSIGLENTAERLSGIKHINDIIPIQFLPLKKEQANELCKKIIAGSGAEFGDGSLEHLYKVVEWLIPFYIQLILDETAKILTDRQINTITGTILDEAVKRIVKQAVYFQHWYNRLRRIYEGNEFKFIKSVLNILSEKGQLSSSKIINLAVNNGLEDSYHNLLNVLKHDGYINNDEDPKIYRFNSPLLKEYWRRNVAN
jgi:hypothetical protein